MVFTVLAFSVQYLALFAALFLAFSWNHRLLVGALAGVIQTRRVPV